MIGRVKICIVSDSHDRAEALERAVKDAAAEGAQAVVHCGDLIGAHTLRLALGAGIPMHVIHGNNMGNPVALHTIPNTAMQWPAPAIGTSYAADIPTRRT